MNNFIHKNAAEGEWYKLSLARQMANIGSEISRAVNWQRKDKKIFESAVYRALDLFDLTLQDSRRKGRLFEIARARELFLNAVYGNEEYGTSLEDLNKYFLLFAFLVEK